MEPARTPASNTGDGSNSHKHTVLLIDAKAAAAMVERTASLEGLLTYDHAGKLLGVTGRTVWTLVHRGDLPAVRFGHSVRIDPADLRAFIDRSKQGRDSDTPGSAGEGGSR